MHKHHAFESGLQSDKAKTGDAAASRTSANLFRDTLTPVGERPHKRGDRTHHTDATDKTTEVRKGRGKHDSTSLDCSRDCPLSSADRAAAYVRRRDADDVTAADGRALKRMDFNKDRMSESEMTAMQHLRKHAMDDDGTGQPLWKKYAPEDPEARAQFKQMLFSGNADYQSEVANSGRSDISESVRQAHRDNVANYGEDLPRGPVETPHIQYVSFSDPIYASSR